jgi:hypothetical protein
MEAGQEVQPATFASAWMLLTSNTLHKTGPQLLVATWGWGFVLVRHDLNSTQFHPAPLVPFAAGAYFCWIAFRRVLGVLPRDGSLLPMLFGLFLAYELWLGFWLPVHRRDVREWLGWAAMASGVMAAVVVFSSLAAFPSP